MLKKISISLVFAIFTTASFASALNSNLEPDKFLEIWNIISDTYLKQNELDRNELEDIAINAVIEALDDEYTEYYNSEEGESFFNHFDGNFYGIGVYVDISENGEIVVISPIKGTPAEKAGLKSKDIIEKVNGKATKGLEIEEVTKLIKGPKNTKVTLTIRRGEQSFDLEITRDEINIPTVEHKYVNYFGNKILEIQILHFTDNTYDEILKIANKVSENAPDGIIIDLQNNPGGVLDGTINILNLFFKKHTTVAFLKNNSQFMSEIQTLGDGPLANYPVKILINEGSASAAEIMAGAFQDNDRGEIIGTTSYGKGSMQEIYAFNDNSAFKITSGTWLTPKGTNIDKKGITPDFTPKIPTQARLEAYKQLRRELSTF
jgi:carboxyl-terminal processing protease